MFIVLVMVKDVRMSVTEAPQNIEYCMGKAQYREMGTNPELWRDRR